MSRSSRITFLTIGIVWFLLSSYKKNWSTTQVRSDIHSYYSYLTAVFIDHDLTLSFLDKPGAKWKGTYWPTTTDDGKHVIKTSMGLSLMYLPFFLVAHYVVAPITGFAQDGYSDAYCASLAAGCFIYLLIGLLYLRKTLLLFYSETIALWVIASIFFASNLLWYAVGEFMMPHQFLFALISLMIYFTIKWYQTPTLKYSALLALACGAILLVRPVDGILCLFPVLYGKADRNYFKEKLLIIKKNWKLVLLMILIIFAVQLPQLIYWKYVSGQWFFYGYKGERFFWDQPHILEGLFSYRKGWLVYTPIMLFALVGLFMLKDEAKKFSIPNLLLIPLFIYIVFCWWIWWYGGSFGARPLVNIYPLLAIPMGAFYTKVMNTGVMKKVMISIISFFMALNIFQMYQYNSFIIHYDAMTRGSYWAVFGKIERPANWWSLLRVTDPKRTLKGLTEAFSEEEVEKGGKFFLRDQANQLFVLNKEGQISLIERSWWADAVDFEFIPLSKNRFIIRSNEKYITLSENTLGANEDVKEKAEIFEMKLIDDNVVELKSKNNYSQQLRLFMAE